ncbi:hypothetical protein [Sphingopyxis granuli]|uniref:Chemotaxis protein n=1 Tax=Sphingopyxis granuli TaxID=267128 RepID=A0AA86GP08_9SPHN|nr:hypothetical protein [Sphingopyxis granuli]AMG75559.1 Chemotaxis protein [Sphingopyxis granuli]
MRSIVREFFRGLRERDELDAIVPELLTATGYEVISRPQVGPRQFGVDVAAVGPDTDGKRKLFLFVIKQGDLTRSDWDVGPQAVRPSLGELRDAYLDTLAPEHQKLPVVVCITVGGVVLQNVKPVVDGFMRRERTPQIEYRVWTGDTLTGMIVDGALREEVFPPERRKYLRRAAALVEEPESSFQQFARLVHDVEADTGLTPVERVRSIYLALWILLVWGREAGNLEAPYRASEYVMLRGWAQLWPLVNEDRSRKQLASHSLFEVADLYLRIWDELYGAKILKHASSRHALSYSVGSRDSLDINLALFETLGRLAIGGLFRAWLETSAGKPLGFVTEPSAKLVEVAKGVAEMIEANRALYTPVHEDQSIDIILALMLLAIVPETQEVAAHYVAQVARSAMISFRWGEFYPVIEHDYASLIRPADRDDEDVRKELTAASILYPHLALFALAFGESDLVTELGEFQTEYLPHCNFQIWVPNARSEEKLWAGRANGGALGNLKIGNDGKELLSAVEKEVGATSHYDELSAIKLDQLPLFLMACRFYRYPPPPHAWLPIIKERITPAQGWKWTRRRAGSVRKVRLVNLLSTARDALLVRQNAEMQP